MAVVALAVACARPDAGQRLSADELQRLVPGATLRGEVADGEAFEGTYFRDGTMAIVTDPAGAVVVLQEVTSRAKE